MENYIGTNTHSGAKAKMPTMMPFRLGALGNNDAHAWWCLSFMPCVVVHRRTQLTKQHIEAVRPASFRPYVQAWDRRSDLCLRRRRGRSCVPLPADSRRETMPAAMKRESGECGEWSLVSKSVRTDAELILTGSGEQLMNRTSW